MAMAIARLYSNCSKEEMKQSRISVDKMEPGEQVFRNMELGGVLCFMADRRLRVK